MCLGGSGGVLPCGSPLGALRRVVLEGPNGGPLLSCSTVVGGLISCLGVEVPECPWGGATVGGVARVGGRRYEDGAMGTRVGPGGASDRAGCAQIVRQRFVVWGLKCALAVWSSRAALVAIDAGAGRASMGGQGRSAAEVMISTKRIAGSCIVQFGAGFYSRGGAVRPVEGGLGVRGKVDSQRGGGARDVEVVGAVGGGGSALARGGAEEGGGSQRGGPSYERSGRARVEGAGRRGLSRVSVGAWGLWRLWVVAMWLRVAGRQGAGEWPR